ncbi:MAG: hypothetical protein KGP14_16925 [Betaproteobacteria bacterium]|nr:hypothetical protein [Betaproteobacteria bacterium]
MTEQTFGLCCKCSRALSVDDFACVCPDCVSRIRNVPLHERIHAALIRDDVRQREGLDHLDEWTVGLLREAEEQLRYFDAVRKYRNSMKRTKKP